MTLQWTIVAIFLYVEIALILLLISPFLSAKIWNKLFKSRFLKRIGAYSNFYFGAFIIILVLLFLDSFREMNKYAESELEVEHAHLDTKLQRSMKMFRAQRNCYISGFALFLVLVIYRLVTLICKQANLMASTEASLKQAQNANLMAESLLKEKEKWESGDTGNSVDDDKLKEVSQELSKTKQELASTKLQLSALKSQAEGTSKEYDRLLAEHAKLQESVGDKSNKKEE